jgi:predicted aminopeptidase
VTLSLVLLREPVTVCGKPAGLGWSNHGAYFTEKCQADGIAAALREAGVDVMVASVEAGVSGEEGKA